MLLKTAGTKWISHSRDVTPNFTSLSCSNGMNWLLPRRSFITDLQFVIIPFSVRKIYGFLSQKGNPRIFRKYKLKDCQNMMFPKRVYWILQTCVAIKQNMEHYTCNSACIVILKTMHFTCIFEKNIPLVYPLKICDKEVLFQTCYRNTIIGFKKLCYPWFNWKKNGPEHW